MIRIPLRVSGVDLDDDGTLELLGEQLADLAWSESDGMVLATLSTSAKNPIAAAVEAARRIGRTLPKADVLDVDQELVSASDIAFRLGVSREAVRLWVEGKRGPGNFPPHVGAVGNGKYKVWPWAVVHAWVRQNYRIGDGEEHLTAQQVAELNCALLQVALLVKAYRARTDHSRADSPRSRRAVTRLDRQAAAPRRRIRASSRRQVNWR